MRTLKSREIIKTIAKEEGVSIADVENVLNVHFEFVRYAQSQLVDRDKGFFPAIRLPNFGVFYVSDAKQEEMRQLNEKKKNT